MSELSRQLRISEIFFSVQGESSRMGLPCIFIRTVACNLRCSWCDTEYAFHGGRSRSVAEIMDEISQWPCKLVELTGGEPMLQKHLPELIAALLDQNYTVMIETGGHMDLAALDPRVIRIIDVKCPGSGEAERNYWPNLENLRQQDEVKFVIKDRADYDYAADVLARYDLSRHCHQVLFSPVFGEMDYQQLAAWLLADGLPVRLQLQMHKYIWAPDARGV